MCSRKVRFGIRKANSSPTTAVVTAFRVCGRSTRVSANFLKNAASAVASERARERRRTQDIELEILEARAHPGDPIFLVPLFVGGASLAAASHALPIPEGLMDRSGAILASAQDRTSAGPRDGSPISLESSLKRWIVSGTGFPESTIGRARPDTGGTAAVGVTELEAHPPQLGFLGGPTRAEGLYQMGASNIDGVGSLMLPALSAGIGTSPMAQFQPMGATRSQALVAVEAAMSATRTSEPPFAISALSGPVPVAPSVASPALPSNSAAMPSSSPVPIPIKMPIAPADVPASGFVTSGFATFVGSWTRSSSGGYQNEAYYIHAAGSGADTASWRFTGLAAGATDYLALTWPANANRATNTPWTVYDSNGTTVLGSGTINQQNVAVGPQAGGVYFQWFVGGFTPTGTTLTITINDNANGYVAADAAYLQAASTAGLVCSAVASGNWSSAATWAPYQPCVPYAITNCANSGGQIEITTASPTNWVTGNTINILGVRGTTEANGSWTITVVDSTDAILNGSSFINNYSSGGSAFRGDSVAIGSGVSVTLDPGACDANGLIIVGSNPNTGGTPAIAWASTITANTGLTVGSSLTLRLRGDLTMWGNPSAPYNYGSLTMSSGSSLIFDPPSGQTYVWNINYSVNLTCNGASNGTWPDSPGGNHVTFETDLSRGGNAAYEVPNNGVPNTAHVWGGLVNCTYTDFVNFGNSTHLGLLTYIANNLYTHSDPISITDCTFNACSYWLLAENTSTWTGQVTFNNNIASNSIPQTQVISGAPLAWGFSLPSTLSPVPNRTIQNNSFDTLVDIDNSVNVVITGDVFAGSLRAQTGAGICVWPNDSYFNNNVIVLTSAINFPLSSIRNCYFLLNSSNKFQALQTTANMTITGCVFEQTTGNGAGDPLIGMNANGLTVEECFVLAAPGDGKAAGYLITPYGHTGIVAEHNLQWGGAPYGMIALGRPNNPASAGTVVSARANIIYSSATGNNTLAVSETGGASSYTLDAVTVAGYNGYYNPTAGPVKYNAGASGPVKVNGYYNLEVSNANAPPNSQLGQGDFVANPQFYDSTRDFAEWGSTLHNTSNGYAGAIAFLQANPQDLGELLTWVRAGYAPTNVAYANATYSGDPLSTDANGNPLTGTVGPMGAVSG
jgi:hypothetical protein